MKNLSTVFNWLLAGILLAVIFLGGLPRVQAQSPLATPTQNASAPSASICDATRSVQTTGSALIYVTPDRAQIQLGVQSNGVTVDEVERLNTVLVERVIQAVRAQGIDSKDISTDVYVIEPVYDNYNSLYIKGYRINNLLALTLRDVKQTSPVIAAALKAGANQVVNVEFYTSELRKYRDQARELAVKAAREKAQALASAAGSQADCPLNISENISSYYNGWWYVGNPNLWTQNVVQNAAPGQGLSGSQGADEPISLGQIAVKAEVSASFGLR